MKEIRRWLIAVLAALFVFGAAFAYANEADAPAQTEETAEAPQPVE